MIKLFIVLVSLISSLIVYAKKSEVLIEGSFKVQELYISAKLQLIKDDDYKLLIYPDSSTQFCEYKVKRITSPQRLKNKRGLIYANVVDECELKGLNEEMSKFWREIKMIDIDYQFENDFKKFEGQVQLSNLNKTYNAKANMKFVSQKVN